MILQQKLSTVQDSRLTLTAASFPQQTIRVPIDRSWPLEEILVTVQVTARATTSIPASAFIFHSLLNLCRRISLEVTDDKGPRTVVNATGPGLLQLIANEGFNLDRSTLSVMQAIGSGFFAATGKYEVTYRIPFVHPMVTGKLRPKMMLPIHLHPQDPVLVLDFAPATEIFSGIADPFTAANVEVVLVRRDWPRELAIAVNKETDGRPLDWFIKSDIMESVFALGASLSNTEQRFPLALPGQYSGLLIHQLKGGTLGTMEDLSGSTTVGSETRWTLESGGTAFRSWRMKQLQKINDFSRVVGPAGVVNSNIFVRATDGLQSSTTAVVAAVNMFMPNANFGGSLATGQAIQSPSSVFHDFISDGINDADELGSLLDCNIPALNGLKMEIVGNITTPAGSTQASSIGIVGRRFYGDLRGYQLTEKLKAA